MIQPQVPLRLPCDDLTHLTELKFGFLREKNSLESCSVGLTGIVFHPLWITQRSHRTDGFPVYGEPPMHLFFETFDFIKVNLLLLSKS